MTETTLTVRHILKSQDFTREIMDHLFSIAIGIEARMWSYSGRLSSRVMCTLFYEPSTRTRLSFEMAAARLGMGIVSTESAGEFSSAKKGETLEDTIRVVSGYKPDVIVLRHPETGAAERAAAVSSVPIINAGDGRGQHPTQALLDIYTIWRSFLKMDHIDIVMVGDLANGRTVRSLTYLLAKYFKYVHITFISPASLRMGPDILGWLEEQPHIRFREADTFDPVTLARADVVYCTRVQGERGSVVTEEEKAKCRIGLEQAHLMRENAIIMHPLPRVGEITDEVDNDPRAWYFQQAANGLHVRMALLLWVFRNRAVSLTGDGQPRSVRISAEKANALSPAASVSGDAAN